MYWDRRWWLWVVFRKVTLKLARQRSSARCLGEALGLHELILAVERRAHEAKERIDIDLYSSSILLLEMFYTLM